MFNAEINAARNSQDVLSAFYDVDPLLAWAITVECALRKGEERQLAHAIAERLTHATGVQHRVLG